MKLRLHLVSSSCFLVIAVQSAAAQMPSPEERGRIEAVSTAERNRELKMLGITAMRPGVTAYDIGKPGNANYDEAKANPFPKLPDLMTMQDGTKVNSAAQWKRRREEIKALFDEDVYGRFPANIPSVTWKVTSTEEMTVADVPATVKHITGHVDNAAYPAIVVDIHADIVDRCGRLPRQVRQFTYFPRRSFRRILRICS
jgi:hypothetical protein